MPSTDVRSAPQKQLAAMRVDAMARLERMTLFPSEVSVEEMRETAALAMRVLRRDHGHAPPKPPLPGEVPFEWQAE